MEDPRPTPEDIIRKYYPLQGAVDPLVELIENEPKLTRHIIELAMVMGIQASRNYDKTDYRDGQRQTDMDRIQDAVNRQNGFWQGY